MKWAIFIRAKVLLKRRDTWKLEFFESVSLVFKIYWNTFLLNKFKNQEFEKLHEIEFFYEIKKKLKNIQKKKTQKMCNSHQIQCSV